MTTDHLLGVPYETMSCVALARAAAAALGRPIPDPVAELLEYWWQQMGDELADGRRVEEQEAEPGDVVLMTSRPGVAGVFHLGVVDSPGLVLHTTRRSGSVRTPLARLRAQLIGIWR